MLIIRLFTPVFLIFFLFGCGEGSEPSSIGKVVEQRLMQGKADFEGKDFSKMLRSSGINPKLQQHFLSVAEAAQSASGFVNPAWAREGIERSELTLACLVAYAKDDDEMEQLKIHLSSVVDDNNARMALLKRMNQLRTQLKNTAFYREACE